MKKKKKKTERERDRKFFGLTRTQDHAKIATVNIHTKKFALSESAKFDQISSLAFPRFWFRNYHTVGECVGLWEKNACFNLVRARMERLMSALRFLTKGFTPKAIFKFATNISRMVRIVRNTGVAVTRTCSRTSAAENSVPHVEWLLTNRKAMTSLCAFLTIIPNIRDTKTLTWRECSTNSVFVIQIYQGATVDYIWIIFLENTEAKCKHFLFVKQEIERQSTCKK